MEKKTIAIVVIGCVAAVATILAVVAIALAASPSSGGTGSGGGGNGGGGNGGGGNGGNNISTETFVWKTELSGPYDTPLNCDIKMSRIGSHVIAHIPATYADATSDSSIIIKGRADGEQPAGGMPPSSMLPKAPLDSYPIAYNITLRFYSNIIHGFVRMETDQWVISKSNYTGVSVQYSPFVSGQTNVGPIDNYISWHTGN